MTGHEPLKADAVVLASLVLAVLSYACAVLVLVGFPNKIAVTIGGVFGPAFGFVASASAGWSSLRLRSRRCFVTFIATIPVVYLWYADLRELIVGRI